VLHTPPLNDLLLDPVHSSRDRATNTNMRALVGCLFVFFLFEAVVVQTKSIVVW